MKARSQSSWIRTRRSERRTRAVAPRWTCTRILRELRTLGEKRNVDGMVHFGIVAKNILWTARRKQFERRAGFALLAYLAYRDKLAPDRNFEEFLPVLVRAATDERHFVRKAVNWALRNIGKRNRRLNALAVRTAEPIRRMDSRCARWIASDALRELRSEAVQRRLRRKAA